MKRRFSYTFAASTLVEILIVIIVSGILFIALFDGVNLVRRYTNRLNKMLAAPVQDLERLTFPVKKRYRITTTVFYVS